MRPRSGFELVPAPAMFIAALVFVAFGAVMLFVAASGKAGGPEVALIAVMGLLGGAILAGIVLLTGYVYGDAKQRGMPAGMWTLLVLLVPNCIGFILYFLLRKPLLVSCANCGGGIEAGVAFCPRCGARVAAGPIYGPPVQTGKAL